MQTLHHELEPSPQGSTPSDHPVLQGLTADSVATHAQEVDALRQRVATLEAALADAEAIRDSAHAAALSGETPPLTSIDFATPSHSQPVVISEFTAAVTPAVVAVTPAPAADASPEADTPPSDLRFAQAWTEGDVTFEERVAERAFFQASSIDEQSRSWLLDND